MAHCFRFKDKSHPHQAAWIAGRLELYKNDKKVPLRPQKRKITKRTHFVKEVDTVDGTKGRSD